MWRIVQNVQRGFRQIGFNQPVRTTNVSQQTKNLDEEQACCHRHQNGPTSAQYTQLARYHSGVSSGPAGNGTGDGSNKREDWKSFKQKFAWSSCGSATMCEAMGWGTAIAVGLHLCRNIGRIDWPTDDDKQRFQRALGIFALAMPKGVRGHLPTARMSILSEGKNQQDAGEKSPELLLSEVTAQFESLADESTATVMNAIGVNYAHEGSLVEAVDHFRQASDAGYSKALYNMGVCYEQGKGVSKSLTTAAECYELAAEEGHPMALYNLAVFYLLGLAGLKKDTKKAIDLMEAAAQQGVQQAQSYLGVYYTEAPHRNMHKAFQLFQGAARDEDPESEYYLGICYEQGWGVASNMAKAADLYAKAAMQGHPGAQYNLAVFHEMGLGGLPMDKAYAKDLYKLASKSGSQLAAQGISRLEMDEKLSLLESTLNKPLPSQQSVPNLKELPSIGKLKEKPKSLHISLSSPALSAHVHAKNSSNIEEPLGIRKHSQSVLDLLFQFKEFKMPEPDIKVSSKEDICGININFDGSSWLSQFGLGMPGSAGELQRRGSFGFGTSVGIGT